MKSCSQISEMITLYIDNKLEDSEYNEFEEHIAGCELCRNELDSMREIVNLCREIPEVNLPDSFKKELHDKLVKEKERQDAEKKSALLRKRYIKICATAAAGLILIFVAKSFLGSAFLKLPTDMVGNQGVREEYDEVIQDTQQIKGYDDKADANEYSVMQGERKQQAKDSIKSSDEIQAFEMTEPDGETGTGASESQEMMMTEEEDTQIKIYENERVLENCKIVLAFTEDQKEFDEQIDWIINAAIQSGAEFPPKWEIAELSIENSTTDKGVYKIGFNIPHDAYNSFNSQLSMDRGASDIEILTLEYEEFSDISNKMEKKLDELNKRIREMESNASISSPEEYRYLKNIRQYFQDEIARTNDNSGLIFVVIEIKNNNK